MQKVDHYIMVSQYVLIENTMVVTCYTIYFALLVMNKALDRHSPVELILQLFACSATFLIG